jgi:protein phosphatase
VLDDIAGRGISRIVNLGDLVGKGPRSAAVVDRCRDVCEVVIQGNWDADVAFGRSSRPGPVWHHAQLGAERNAYLSQLPGSVDYVMGGRAVRFYHASHVSPFHRVYETAPREVHRDMFLNTGFTGAGPVPEIVGYGDIHTPYVVSFEGRTLFNAGSVGNPLDMPLACYAIIEMAEDQDPGPWGLSFARVPYDIESELAVARSMEMPDLDHYARELRTAVYRGLTVYGTQEVGTE